MIFRARIPLCLPIQFRNTIDTKDIYKIPCLSADFVASPWCEDNLGEALNKLKPRADRINMMSEDKRILLIDRLSKKGWIDWV